MMLGFFNKLARAPWWIFVVLAAGAAYFGWFAEEYPIFSGEKPQLVPLLLQTIPQLEPAFAWLESMGFDSSQITLGSGLGSSGSSLGGGVPRASIGGLNDEPTFASKAQIFAGFFAFVAAWKLFFSVPGSSKEKESFLNDPKTVNAMLKNATVQISQEAWDNPLMAVKPDIPGAEEDPDKPQLRLKPRKAAAKQATQSAPAQGQVARKPAKAAKASRGGLFRRGHRETPEMNAERKALEDLFRAKMETDPFDKLVREARA